LSAPRRGSPPAVATRAVALAIIWLSISAAACGEGLVPGNTYDRPLFVLHGTVRPAGGLASARNRAGTGVAVHPLVSLLWTDPLQQRPDRPAPAGMLRSSVDAASDQIALEIFRPPPPELLVEVAAPSGGESARLAVAEIVIIDDGDGDGDFRVGGARAEIAAPDQYLAGTESLLIYVARPFSSPPFDFPLVPGTATGYQLVSYSCVGLSAVGVAEVAADLLALVMRPSSFLPEIRTCRRSHSP
jgi:hypothetical protein